MRSVMGSLGSPVEGSAFSEPSSHSHRERGGREGPGYGLRGADLA